MPVAVFHWLAGDMSWGSWCLGSTPLAKIFLRVSRTSLKSSARFSSSFWVLVFALDTRQSARKSGTKRGMILPLTEILHFEGAVWPLVGELPGAHKCTLIVCYVDSIRRTHESFMPRKCMQPTSIVSKRTGTPLQWLRNNSIIFGEVCKWQP